MEESLPQHVAEIAGPLLTDLTVADPQSKHHAYGTVSRTAAVGKFILLRVS